MYAMLVRKLIHFDCSLHFSHCVSKHNLSRLNRKISSCNFFIVFVNKIKNIGIPPPPLKLIKSVISDANLSM